MTDATQKANEILQGEGKTQQIEAFPSKEAQVAAALEGAIAQTEAKEADLAAEKPESVPEKPTEAPKEAKEPEKEPEPVKEPEATPEEPQLTARERFAQTAAKEAEEREGRQEVKEYKAKLEETQAQLTELKGLQDMLRTDPLSFFEKHMPADTYEKLTGLYAKGEKPTPQSAELRALRDDLKAIRDELKTTREETGKASQQNWIKDYMRDIDRLSVGEDYKAIRDYSAQFEKLTGQAVNLHQAAAAEYDEFAAMYPNSKPLTPSQVLEILNEKAEERLARTRPETPAVEEKQPEPKRAAKKPAKTLTNALEAESDASDGTIPMGSDRMTHVEQVAAALHDKMWQGNPEK